jgi:hypothetical protein
MLQRNQRRSHVKTMRWAGHVARIGEKMNAYGSLVWKGRGKRGLGIPRHRLGILLKWIIK